MTALENQLDVTGQGASSATKQLSELSVKYTNLENKLETMEKLSSEEKSKSAENQSVMRCACYRITLPIISFLI